MLVDFWMFPNALRNGKPLRPLRQLCRGGLRLYEQATLRQQSREAPPAPLPSKGFLTGGVFWGMEDLWFLNVFNMLCFDVFVGFSFGIFRFGFYWCCMVFSNGLNDFVSEFWRIYDGQTMW